MESLFAVLAVLGAVLLGAVSPGPSFVMVARTAIAISRRGGLATALGMGIGSLIFAGAALLGLHALLTSVPWLYLAIKIAGGTYLLYLAFRLWIGADDRISIGEVCAGTTQRGIFRSFIFGLITQLSNPKTAVWYASIFTAFLSANQPRGLAVIILPMIFLIETGWYAFVALLFSSARPRSSYLRLKPRIDRAAAGIMGLLGLKLILQSR
jgi:threonine/homoserine/homoserine lactone efflux protein